MQTIHSLYKMAGSYFNTKDIVLNLINTNLSKKNANELIAVLHVTFSER